jgi:hypothetical protein
MKFLNAIPKYIASTSDPPKYLPYIPEQKTYMKSGTELGGAS